MHTSKDRPAIRQYTDQDDALADMRALGLLWSVQRVVKSEDDPSRWVVQARGVSQSKWLSLRIDGTIR
jgi:hypothetical protein